MVTFKTVWGPFSRAHFLSAISFSSSLNMYGWSKHRMGRASCGNWSRKVPSMHTESPKTWCWHRFLDMKALLQRDNVLNKNILNWHRDLTICVGEKCAKLRNGESPERSRSPVHADSAVRPSLSLSTRQMRPICTSGLVWSHGDQHRISMERLARQTQCTQSK